MNEASKTPEFKKEEMKMPENLGQSEGTVPHSAATGPIIVVLAVLLLGVLGGMYYWFTVMQEEPIIVPEVSRPTPVENNEPESTTAEAQTDGMGVVSSSDELDAINADLESTNMESLDAEIGAIEAELEAGGQ